MKPSLSLHTMKRIKVLAAGVIPTTLKTYSARCVLMVRVLNMTRSYTATDAMLQCTSLAMGSLQYRKEIFSVRFAWN